ncbi:MAG: cytochrome b [Rhodocyclales bacterium GT-UBC]|nr:MAG: cytochrome b [Rhodocyclales bacterium GT-UBC]
MNTQRYSLPAMALHWAQAILVIWLLWLGWTMIDLPKGPGRSTAYNLHKSLGMLTFLLVIVRIGWRQWHPGPPLTVTGNAARLARLTHGLLYIFLIAAPLAGYLASSFTPYAIKLFGIEVPKAGWPDESLNAFFKSIHVLAVWAGAGLIGLHVAGALRHGFGRSGVLYRMLPVRLFRN